MTPFMQLFNPFLLGAIVMACVAIGLFFLRFWRQTRDRLFLIFAIAFWALGVNWLALAWLTAISHDANEVRTALYTMRLLAFIVILWGIFDKNRTRQPQPSPSPSPSSPPQPPQPPEGPGFPPAGR